MARIVNDRVVDISDEPITTGNARGKTGIAVPGMVDMGRGPDSAHAKNDRLRLAMTELAVEDGVQARQRLYEAFRDSTLLVPMAEPIAAPTGWHVTTQKTTVRPAIVEGWHGERYIMAFTNEPALQRWQPRGTPYLELPAKDLSSLVRRNRLAGIVLDRESQVEGILRSEVLRTLAQGDSRTDEVGLAEEFSLPAGRAMKIGAPAQLPTDELLRELGDAVWRELSIEEAYLVQAAAEDEAPHLAVALILSGWHGDGDASAVVDRLTARIQRLLGPAEHIDFYIIRDASDLNSVRELGEAIVKRTRRRPFAALRRRAWRQPRRSDRPS